MPQQPQKQKIETKFNAAFSETNITSASRIHDLNQEIKKAKF